MRLYLRPYFICKLISPVVPKGSSLSLTRAILSVSCKPWVRALTPFVKRRVRVKSQCPVNTVFLYSYTYCGCRQKYTPLFRYLPLRFVNCVSDRYFEILGHAQHTSDLASVSTPHYLSGSSYLPIIPIVFKSPIAATVSLNSTLELKNKVLTVRDLGTRRTLRSYLRWLQAKVFPVGHVLVGLTFLAF
ncbi:hypothetical protein LZ30DRAFT_718441 [Colletotrichum cereale]|nr:hypothetical protein LZ30DRAFT_718441 [Colletotrichum cereale]